MKYAKYIIPNGITLLNIVAGSCAIIFTLEDYSWLPVYCLVAAAFFDFLDGFTAKLLKATSEFGKQLDSIADIVSFGLAPAIFMYKLMITAFDHQGEGNFIPADLTIGVRLILFSSLSLVVFAALRLARFNIAKAYSSDFKGLPVPASALFVVSMWVVAKGESQGMILNAIQNLYALISVTIILSLLMISNIPMISLKFEGLGIILNIWRYILLVGAIILFVIFGLPSLIYIMLFYIILSFIKVIANLERK